MWNVVPIKSLSIFCPLRESEIAAEQIGESPRQYYLRAHMVDSDGQASTAGSPRLSSPIIVSLACGGTRGGWSRVVCAAVVIVVRLPSAG